MEDHVDLIRELARQLPPPERERAKRDWLQRLLRTHMADALLVGFPSHADTFRALPSLFEEAGLAALEEAVRSLLSTVEAHRAARSKVVAGSPHAVGWHDYTNVDIAVEILAGIVGTLRVLSADLYEEPLCEISQIVYLIAETCRIDLGAELSWQISDLSIRNSAGAGGA